MYENFVKRNDENTKKIHSARTVNINIILNRYMSSKADHVKF